MIGKMSRKGKNPGPVDSWLDTLGYYRKNVAYDETCMFRAVSEQLYSCQIFHERVRKECIEFGRENYDLFSELESSKEEWFDHLEKLSTHMAVCGIREIHIISKKYKRNVMLFDSIQRRVQDICKSKYDETLLLCLMPEDHFDVVYKKEYITTAGFCQSIAYNTLYENVFHIQQVSDIVKTMLYDKSPFLSGHTFVSDDTNVKKEDENESSVQIKNKQGFPLKPEYMSDYEFMLQTNLAPFPFKVAKALDPSIYRNIEYDTWTEIRKEMKLGDWYYGDNKLILGTKCILLDKGETLQCYIQEILKKTNQCVVFITSRAEKRTVNYDDLRPENDAKPWPLPYRFSKNVVVLPQVEVTEKDNKIIKKRKDKKNGNLGEGKSSQTTALKLDISNKINTYEGCPLQMQPIDYQNEKGHSPMETSDGFTPNDPAIIQWTSQWDVNIPHTPVMWTHTPVTPQGVYSYPVKQVPATPDTPNTESVFYYDNRYTSWQSPEYTEQQNNSPQQNVPVETPMSPDSSYGYIYYPENAYIPASPAVQSPQVCMPMIPPTQVDVYPQVYSQPNTPLVYPPNEVSDMIMPQPPPITLYTPPAFEYIPTPICMVPTTPNNNWYPPNVNSHGFIFPAPPNTQNIPTRI